MNFNKKLATAVSGAVLLMAGQFALADSTTDIVDALVSKGVLTEEEGKLISKGHESKKKAEGTVGFKDGFKLNSGDGKSSMSINGRIQLDARSYDWEGGNAANDKVTDTFDVRRAYLGAKGTFQKYYDWEVTADFASLTGTDATSDTTAAGKTTTHLDVAYFNINYFNKKAMFQFGQFKMPYSLEERTSSRFIDFQERSYVNNTSLTPGKERGMMIHGTPFTGVNYALALSTGQGKNVNDVDQRTGGIGYIGHIDTNIAEIIGDKESVYHLGASYSSDSDMPVAAPGKQRTEARGYELFAASAFTGNNMDRTRVGLEAAIARGPVKIQAEYSKANFEGTSALGVAYDRDIKAYYAEALWLITGEKYADSYKGGKFDRISPKKDFNPEDFSSLGAFELGARYSKFDASDFVASNATGTGVLSSSTGNTNKADSYVVGLKWIPSPNTRFLLNYVYTDFDTDITKNTETRGKEKALIMRTQYDF
jgi:phosphate-selective porin OprO/OprP